MRLSPVIPTTRRRRAWVADLILIATAAGALDLIIICLWSHTS